MPRHSPIITRRRVVAGLAAYPASHFAFAEPSIARFHVFDGLLHQHKPRSQALGLEPLPAVSEIWRRGVSKDGVDEEGIIAALNRVPVDTEIIFLDIEVWPLLQVTPSVRRSSIDKFIRVAEIVRSRRPALKFGFYGTLPALTYWPLVAPQFPQEAAEWRAANQALRPLSELVDIIYPSLYTFYTDHSAWLRYAAASLEAARDYGKPVYPFLWFEYHDSNSQPHDRELDPTAWRDELRFCRSHADGVVLWGGYMRPWSERATWWQIAQSELPLNN